MDIKIVIPAMGESVGEGEITEWYKKEGEAVKRDENLVVIETDKVTVELPSPAAGVLKKILKDVGSVVTIGETIGVIESEGVAMKPSESKPAETAPAPKPFADIPLSPAVRRLVAETGVDPASVKGSGKAGRILKSDVADLAEKAATPPAPATAAPTLPSSNRVEERVRMTRMRKRTAERLLESQSTTASLTTFNDVDLSRVMEFRAQFKDKFQKKYGISLGFMSFFIKASIEALKAFPAVNAMIDGDDIVYRNYYDIGVAVSTDKGLVVPVIRNAERLSFAETELAVADLAKRTRENRLTIQELVGGTFSITNGGVFGSLLSTPILNPPQSGILGMHRIEKRPVVKENDQIVVRPMMYLALTYDHRIIDGREAVSSLVRIKECLEDPTRILLEV